MCPASQKNGTHSGTSDYSHDDRCPNLELGDDLRPLSRKSRGCLLSAGLIGDKQFVKFIDLEMKFCWTRMWQRVYEL